LNPISRTGRTATKAITGAATHSIAHQENLSLFIK